MLNHRKCQYWIWQVLPFWGWWQALLVPSHSWMPGWSGVMMPLILNSPANVLHSGWSFSWKQWAQNAGTNRNGCTNGLFFIGFPVSIPTWYLVRSCRPATWNATVLKKIIAKSTVKWPWDLLAIVIQLTPISISQGWLWLGKMHWSAPCRYGLFGLGVQPPSSNWSPARSTPCLPN